MKNLKTTIAALVCACSLAFQAKAQTIPPTDISNFGSVSITSIDSSTASNATVYNNGTEPVATTASNNANVVFFFSGVINDISQIKQNDVITIPISVAAGSHFPNLGLSFNSSLAISDGSKPPLSTPFTVSYSNNLITLTANSDGVGSGAATFVLQGSVMLTTTGATLQQLQADSTVYILDNNPSLSYRVNNTPSLTLQPNNTCNTSLANGASTDSSNLAIAYAIRCVYNNLLANPDETQADLLAAYPALGSNFIEVATIPANTQIASIAIKNGGHTFPYMNYVMSDNTSVSGTNIAGFTGSNVFSQNNSITDTSMANLEANMTAGQYAIVPYPDGSYAIVIDWGALLNNINTDTYAQYPAGANVQSYDENSNNLMQEAMGINLSALSNQLNFNVTYANGVVKDSIPGVTVRSNLAGKLLANGGNIVLQNTPLNNVSSGQTTITVNYVTQNGVPLRQSIPNHGYPQNNSLGYAATVLSLTPPADTLGLQLLTPAQVQKFGTASALGIKSTTVDSIIVYQDSSTYYPTSGILQIYYVYANPSLLPITGLQLTAQPQANNDVLLTWGTITEINSQSFTVQRSSDGGKTWVTINTQPTQAANGNSSVPLTYQLTDLSVPIGSYEYRVVETDVDGSTTTSNVVQIVITGGGQVFPNPANTLLNVKLPAGANSVPYRLISADGKIVLSGTMTNTGNYGTISVVAIASDIYFLQITVNSAVQTYEVRIQH